MGFARAFGASAVCLFISTVIGAAACSASSGTGSAGFGGDAGGGSNSPAGGLGGHSSSDDGGGFPGGPASGSGTGAGSCASTSTKAMAKPLDMFIMLDQSSSMLGTKWKSVTAALGSFVAEPAAAGLGVGLGYFGATKPACQIRCNAQSNPCGSGCGPCIQGLCEGAYDSNSCDVGYYATPAVEIATLPGNGDAQITALTDSIAAHGPITGTPTLPALAGALQHTKAWATAHPDHVVIVVLATDGQPSDTCTVGSYNNDVAGVSSEAADGYATSPSIPTFVIGVGSDLSDLNQVAMAGSGGTQNAFIVSSGGNATQEFLDALNKIRGASLGCSYSIPMPDGKTPDFNKVNVEYKPGGGGMTQTIPNVDDLAHCPTDGTDAWYYDNASAPTQIIMCPGTCTKLSNDTTGEVDVAIGCNTVKVPK